jgi:hypothetical protein
MVAPMRKIIVEIADPMTDIIVIIVAPMTDTIVIMATQMTDIVTSRGPLVHRYLYLNQHGRVDRIKLPCISR